MSKAAAFWLSSAFTKTSLVLLHFTPCDNVHGQEGHSSDTNTVQVHGVNVLCGSAKHDTDQLLAGGSVTQQPMSGETPQHQRRVGSRTAEEQAWSRLPDSHSRHPPFVNTD